MKSGAAVLEVRKLEKSYGRVKALAGVDLTVREGEFVALLGPNGAGKSTLLQLLTGLFSPDNGSIMVLGNDLRRSAIRALAGIGVVFQQPTLDLELSVRANLLFHADLHGLNRRAARERIDASLKRFGLADRARDRARTLSGGNRRRVELVRALLHRPHILLMDEATVGLDPASRRDILNDILRLCREENIGVLWTTHLVDEVEVADRVVVLNRGKVLFDGLMADLLLREKTDDMGAAFIQITGGDAAPNGQPMSAAAAD
ncbi:MAG: ATP-binding cassette domain-containing protein [Bauldia sp.]|nr:ATP-binding cassette domain-containing protein [Bauldia sp.]MCW5777605.1 ATP-binding cassette domain-containing protein [Phycisphaeraceae bacterium]